MKKFTTIILLLLCTLSLQPFPAGAATQVLLEDIAFSGPSVNQEQVTLQLNGPAIPKVFALKSGTPRIVFDFPQTIPSIKIPNILATNGAIINQIRTGVHTGTPPKTRVVLDLAAVQAIHFDHSFDQANNTLTVIVYGSAGRPGQGEQDGIPSQVIPQKQTPALQTAVPEDSKEAPVLQKEDLMQQESSKADVQAPPTTPPVSHADDIDAKKQPILESVEFDNTSNRGEMVMFKLNAFYPPVVFGIEEENPRVVCDFKKTRALPSVPNLIEANGRYVRSIRIGKHYDPDKVRIVLDLAPNSYDLQQVFFKEDNLFVVIINTLANAPSAEEIEKPLKR